MLAIYPKDRRYFKFDDKFVICLDILIRAVCCTKLIARVGAENSKDTNMKDCLYELENWAGRMTLELQKYQDSLVFEGAKCPVQYTYWLSNLCLSYIEMEHVLYELLFKESDERAEIFRTVNRLMSTKSDCIDMTTEELLGVVDSVHVSVEFNDLVPFFGSPYVHNEHEDELTDRLHGVFNNTSLFDLLLNLDMPGAEYVIPVGYNLSGTNGWKFFGMALEGKSYGFKIQSRMHIESCSLYPIEAAPLINACLMKELGSDGRFQLLKCTKGGIKLWR